jgi:hypothetical protein
MSKMRDSPTDVRLRRQAAEKLLFELQHIASQGHSHEERTERQLNQIELTLRNLWIEGWYEGRRVPQEG